MTKVTEVLDTRGLKCPIPVLKARKAMKSLDSGQQIRVYATDPGAVQDFAEFCSVAGHHLLESADEAGVLSFLIQKA